MKEIDQALSDALDEMAGVRRRLGQDLGCFAIVVIVVVAGLLWLWRHLAWV